MFKFNIFGNIIFKKAFIITSKEGNAMNKKTMYNLTYGLFVLTSAYEGKDSGCIINTAGQVTSEPNRISITVNKANFTHDLVRDSGKHYEQEQYLRGVH